MKKNKNKNARRLARDRRTGAGNAGGGRRACWISRAMLGCVDAASQREHRCRRPRFRPRGQQPHGGRGGDLPIRAERECAGASEGAEKCHPRAPPAPCATVTCLRRRGAAKGNEAQTQSRPFRKGRPRARRLCTLTLSSPLSSRHARLRSRPSSRPLEVSQDDSRVPSSRRASVFVTTEKLLRRRKAQRTSTVG